MPSDGQSYVVRTLLQRAGGRSRRPRRSRPMDPPRKRPARPVDPPRTRRLRPAAPPRVRGGTSFLPDPSTIAAPGDSADGSYGGYGAEMSGGGIEDGAFSDGYTGGDSDVEAGGHAVDSAQAPSRGLEGSDAGGGDSSDSASAEGEFDVGTGQNAKNGAPLANASRGAAHMHGLQQAHMAFRWQ